MLAAILAVTRDRCGTDFRGYRPQTALRRVRNRMAAARVSTLPEYLARLRADPAEPALLVERLTIKVSWFFRNPDAVEAVRAALAARRSARPGAPISVWSAGCGRGEEAYTLAMLLADLGEPADRGPRVLATDIDAAALAAAARGIYPADAIADVPRAARARHLERLGDGAGWCVADGLRRRVELRRQDLTRESAPDGRTFDLVACRNVLIYLQGGLRRRVEATLVASVAPGGLLWMGEAELPGDCAARLEAVDRRARLFRRTPAPEGE